MSDSVHDIQFPLADFDREQLPQPQRDLQGDAYLQAVQEHLSSQFLGQGGAAEVAVTSDRVIIRWKDHSEAESITQQGTRLVQQGDTEKGIATLRVALQRNSDDAAALFNLGVALSNQNQLAESLELLNRLVQIAPEYPCAWVALGVTQSALHGPLHGLSAFQEAVRRNSMDGFARKNLGAALSGLGRFEEALEHLKAAVVLLPQDAVAWLNLGMNLEQSGNHADAATAYRQVMILDPGGRYSEKAEQGRNRIAQQKFRASGGSLRQDALDHLGEALRLFDRMTPDQIKRLTHEIVMLGAKGLAVENTQVRYQLRTLPGEFTGLQLLCLEYVGLKLIDPSVDLGFDLGAEYEEACRLHRLA